MLGLKGWSRPGPGPFVDFPYSNLRTYITGHLHSIEPLMDSSRRISHGPNTLYKGHTVGASTTTCIVVPCFQHWDPLQEEGPS